MIGDFNANLVMGNVKNKSVFGEYLKNFAKDGQYVISDLNLLPSNSYTYVSYSWNNLFVARSLCIYNSCL